ncbi:ABC transporter permease [Streptomyces antioxidans]|uniref:ABC transporter permease n=1 Tax=Streptomyces antioxidans TaxID=1507734 RepID=A0A1V4CUC0_9ACTN|nr:FtsX-like permease family protein [Streptomyces antioxidans]OPF70701.1 ABC transporter permease [Streptomyces antioxidans]
MTIEESAAEPRERTALPRRGAITRWAADLAMGARFAVTGGRESWARTLMTAIGVGLGVALLLLASSAPHAYHAREDRSAAREAYEPGNDTKPKAGPHTIRIAGGNTTFREDSIEGTLLAPDGNSPPKPPGVDRLPAPGQMWVSPALKKLLADHDLLRQRLPYRVVGTIADGGLSGPADLRYYAGVDAGVFGDAHAERVDHWGTEPPDQVLSPGVLLLVVVGCVVLLVPVLIFIATAARFGGERRDRRLAALRLVGADSHMTRRIAAGEALFGSLLGLAAGGLMFLAVRRLVSTVSLWDVSFFAADIRPSAPLALLIAVVVPASAVLVTLFALRGIAIEPLGVVRNATPRRRRLWWRLLLPVLGMGLLVPLAGGFGATSHSRDAETYQAAAGAVLVLIGTTALLPWLVEAVVERFGRGPVSWQLATRRLQLSSGTAARAVSGITVAVAGAIAIQMLFATVQDTQTKLTGQDPQRAQIGMTLDVDNGAQASAALAKYRATKGVRQVFGSVGASVAEARSKATSREDVDVQSITVADCPTLREMADIGRCSDGDVFLGKLSIPYEEEPDFAKPGAQVNLRLDHNGNVITRNPELWTIPRSTRTVTAKDDPQGAENSGILATPGAIDVARLSDPTAQILLRLDPRVPDAAEYARNTGAALTPVPDVYSLTSTTESGQFSAVRKGLFIGATATLLLIGASMVVSTLEQLRERRRLLSVLVAFGTRRATLSWSVLWQTAIPVVLGLALSIAGGLALGTMLLEMVNEPWTVDWTNLTLMTGVGAGVIGLVTLVSLPPLWRMMRPEGLRTE